MTKKDNVLISVFKKIWKTLKSIFLKLFGFKKKETWIPTPYHWQLREHEICKEVLQGDKIEHDYNKHLSEFYSSLEGDEPVAIIINGLNGTGKSTMALKFYRHIKNKHPNKKMCIIGLDCFKVQGMQKTMDICAKEQIPFFPKGANPKSRPLKIAKKLISRGIHKTHDVIIVDMAGRGLSINLLKESEAVFKTFKTALTKSKTLSIININGTSTISANDYIVTEFSKFVPPQYISITKCDDMYVKREHTNHVFSMAFNYLYKTPYALFVSTDKDKEECETLDIKKYIQEYNLRISKAK